ncbi:hypothetical protein PC129_g2438 [Phytophthora cactorum]|uniref:Uncharacterized protein n=1 Tax=Phytophthora cactorum TaxID=29920 RepID=A0A8T1IPP5_9STRA|nr:hypothetical protein PC114_g4458 [Phytophthora cactorum]KAG2938412.1 hypothetical protein PC115_g3734 [Phytophthora cactorum]KAG2950702.1 hypothetical protein PC117_g4209 [Phytophthora cactorum]KAG3031977.1 hypothetical protein PC120_g2755 [Phytophthora cactorum]KAG3085914.1 hypothetical protein PC121_g5046 [Phytophthora cactorum]
MEASSQPEKRVDSPRAFCNSPSSISDVDFSRSSTDKAMPDSDKIDNTHAESGDELDAQDAPSRSSAKPIKRLRRGSTNDYLPTDIEEDEEGSYEHPESSVFRDGCAPGYDSAADVECSSDSPRRSRRTLYIEYWSRTDECKERKWDHLDEIAENYGSAEEHIFATTLKGRTAFLEPNMFPYDTPAGIEHWTLWHVKDLNHEQVKQYVENWIDANAPHVERWNYDDNPERSIDIFHVHVYFQVAEGLTVLQDRKVENLVHELD